MANMLETPVKKLDISVDNLTSVVKSTNTKISSNLKKTSELLRMRDEYEDEIYEEELSLLQTEPQEPIVEPSQITEDNFGEGAVSGYERALQDVSSSQEQKEKQQERKQDLIDGITGSVIATGTIASLPRYNTLPGQKYGAPRDDDKDGRPDRKHAGQDFDISGDEVFYSRIGGRVKSIKYDPTPYGYGKYVDIENDELGVVERIAEGRTVLVKQGQVLKPGDPVVKGETYTGVIHYEIRTDGGGYGYEGTVDPIPFLNKYTVTADKKSKQEISAITAKPQNSQVAMAIQPVIMNQGGGIIPVGGGGAMSSGVNNKGSVQKQAEIMSGIA